MVGDRVRLNSGGINAGCRRFGSRSGVIASEVKSRGGCTIIWDGAKTPKAVHAAYLEHEADTGSVTLASIELGADADGFGIFVLNFAL